MMSCLRALALIMITMMTRRAISWARWLGSLARSRSRNQFGGGNAGAKEWPGYYDVQVPPAAHQRPCRRVTVTRMIADQAFELSTSIFLSETHSRCNGCPLQP